MSSFQLNMYSFFVILFICAISEVSANWGYGPDNIGPAFWKTTYHQCGGVSQSPINLDDTVAEMTDLGNFHLEGYFDAPEPGVMQLRNTGYTASVDLLRDYSVSGGSLGGTYKALQFHFHWGAKNMRGSEHAINAKFYPGEMHIVHWDNTTYPDVSTAIKSPKGLAVLGFFLDICTPTNPAIEKFGVDIPSIEREGDVPVPMTQLIRLGDLIKGAKMDDYYRYNGSLTTPGCWESVIWTVFKRPICVSLATISRFRMLKAITPQRVVTPIWDNFRPIQALNARTLIHSVRPGSRHSDFCEVVRVAMCQEVGFSMTSFPNMFGHQTQEEAERELERWRVLIDSGCSHRLQNFLCSAYIPACDGGASFIPCRETCRDVQKTCAVAMLKTRIDWPQELACTPLPGLGKTNHDCLAETRPPLSIKHLMVGQISRNRVKLSWTGPTHTRTEVRHYEVTMANIISGLMHKETVSVSRNEFNTGALRPGTYIFTIKAVNYLGDGPTETRSIAVKDIVDEGSRFNIKIEPRQYPIQNRGEPNMFKAFVDVQAQGVANDYCRIVKDGTSYFLTCALAGAAIEGDMNYNVTGQPNFIPGYPDTWYMKDENSDGRDDYCRCIDVGMRTQLSCIPAGVGGFEGAYEYPPVSQIHSCQSMHINPILGP